VFNHARTLLLNQSGDPPMLGVWPGEELIPPAYRELTLPQAVLTARDYLFGQQADRLALNYRVRQYMNLLHSTELAEYVTALDPRITYDTTATSTLQDAFGIDIQAVGRAARTTLANQQPSGLQVLGQTTFRFTVTLQEAQAEVLQVVPTIRRWLTPVTFTDGLGSLIPLVGTGYYCRPTVSTVGAAWFVNVRLQPTLTLGEIAAALELCGEPTLLGLFGLSRTVEPYATFRNLWESRQGLAYRLGGLLLAVIYRSEEVRLGTS